MAPELSPPSSQPLAPLIALADRIRAQSVEVTEIEHARELAQKLAELFNDDALTLSALLHHSRATIDALDLPSPELRAMVNQTLLDNAGLQSLRFEDPDVAGNFRAQMLPNLRECRAPLLFVYDHLHHFDPTWQLLTWVRGFHTAPSDLPATHGPSALSGGSARASRPRAELYLNLIAPAAEHLGLWNERDAAEDIALCLDRPERARYTIDYILTAQSVRAHARNALDRVQDVLRDSVSDVRWEWRHLASLSTRLPDTPPSPLWDKHLHRCGYVTVVCRSRTECYLALATLHGTLKYSSTQMWDTLGAPTASGYAALHTTVSDDWKDSAIAVRLVPRDRDADRFAAPTPQLLDRLERTFGAGEHQGIRVFTPDGRGCELPVGATVLHFARRQCSAWVARVRGATVNQVRVGPLHPLRHGDVVTLDLFDRDTPAMLPNGWEKVFRGEVRCRIRRDTRRALTPYLERKGLEYLRLILERRHPDVCLDPDVLNHVVASAWSAVVTRRSQGRGGPATGHSVEWLLCEVGLHSERGEGRLLAIAPQLSRWMGFGFLRQLVNTLRRLNLVSFSELMIPEDVRQRVHTVSLCTECAPRRGEEIVAAVRQDGLVVHRRGCTMGYDAHVPVRWTAVMRPVQYFVVEAKDRCGILVDVLSVFTDHAISVRGCVARCLGPQWFVVRVQASPVGQVTVEVILSALRKLAGVTRVIGPDDEPVPLLEGPLPPRVDYQQPYPQPRDLPPPYVCGRPVVQDEYFYGMVGALGELRTILEECRLGDSGGCAIWIKGPKKIGKTSLAKRFLSGCGGPECVILKHFPASLEESWVECSRELHEQAERAIRARLGPSEEMAGAYPLSDDLEGSLRQLIESGALPLIIVIDEALWILKNSNHVDAMRALQRFRAFYETTPNVLVLWIGPEAGVDQLPREASELLQAAQPVEPAPLSVLETQALLVAQKLSPRYSIQIEEGLGERVAVLTGGNPYWTNHLAREMWTEAVRTASGPVFYAGELVDHAVERLIVRRTPFIDRLRGPNTAGLPDELVRRVLHMLAPPRRAEHEDVRPLSADEMLTRLTGTALPIEQLPELLQFLEAQGTIRQDPNRQDAQAWRIAPPLLLSFVRKWTSGVRSQRVERQVVRHPRGR